MEINGRYSVKTLDGHTPDECKSAMQKYARRGDASKMYYAVQQLNSLIRYDEANRLTVLPTIKATRTNAINRLSVILFEDVSFRDVNAFEKTCSLIAEWKATRTESVDGDDGSGLLKQICVCISNAKKARQPSFLRNYYGHRVPKATAGDFERMMEDSADRARTPSFDRSFSWVYQNELEAYEWLADKTKSLGAFKPTPMIRYALKEWKRLKTSPRVSDRFIFLVVPMLWIKYGWDEEPVAAATLTEITRLEKFDDFVYDMHTRRGGTKSKFVKEGAYVTNEDSAAIDLKMKEMYVGQVVPVRSVRVAIFSDVKMITAGLCGGKLPCFHATFRGEKKIVKPFTKSLNFGLDYAYVDAQKRLFGIPELNVKLVEARGLAVVKRREPKFVLVTESDERQVFAVMTEVVHKGDLGLNKHLLDSEEKYDEMLKIRIVNGIFRTSDNILRNILVRTDGAFVPIDENDVLGKREAIFNSTEPIKKGAFWSVDRLVRIVKSLNLAEHKRRLLDDLSVYGLEDKRAELSDRIDRYEEIVANEAARG